MHAFLVTDCSLNDNERQAHSERLRDQATAAWTKIKWRDAPAMPTLCSSFEGPPTRKDGQIADKAVPEGPKDSGVDQDRMVICRNDQKVEIP